MHSLTVCTMCFLLIDLISLNQPIDNDIKIGGDKNTFLRFNEVDYADMVTRIATGIGTWNGTYIMILLLDYTLAFISLLLGLGPRSSWPPLYGRFSDAWSIRQL